MTQRTATIELINGHVVELRALTFDDMMQIRITHAALFDELVEGRRSGNLDIGKLWPRILPALHAAIAIAADVPDEAAAVAAWPFSKIMLAAWKLYGLTSPPSGAVPDMLPVSSKSLLPFSQVLAQLGAAAKTPFRTQ